MSATTLVAVLFGLFVGTSVWFGYWAHYYRRRARASEHLLTALYPAVDPSETWDEVRWDFEANKGTPPPAAKWDYRSGTVQDATMGSWGSSKGSDATVTFDNGTGETRE